MREDTKKEAIRSIVAEKLESAQLDHAFAMRAVEDAENVLDIKNTLLQCIGRRLIDIEEIHNAITQD